MTELCVSPSPEVKLKGLVEALALRLMEQLPDRFSESLYFYSPSSSSRGYSLSDRNPLLMDNEMWSLAEQRINEILYIIQPAQVSDMRRKAVVDYIQSLLRNYYKAELFTFGSVPFKTYLPDGDIDLTAVIHQHNGEDMARDICRILEGAAHGSDFEIKDIQYVRAQVKVVKCSVNNIAVDISFNQIAGLCTLFFLEEVNKLIGKDHLFKRSIILIKAWCYYESRILGAYSGLISTYGLETLVLYIINLFHSSLRGPLEVLYRFLDYYSTFDWENHCLSINGPVALSSLTDIVVNPDENELLLSPGFLKKCKDRFSVPVDALESMRHEFPIKHLNIVDPLKEKNNLGRSVSKGNFHRIKFAISFGARRLKEILRSPGEIMGGELENFFVNTLARNGKGERADLKVVVPIFGTGKCEASDLSGDYENFFTDPLDLPPQLSPVPTPSQVENSWDQLVHHSNISNTRATDAYFLRRPLYNFYAPQLCSSSSSSDKMRKSRGTGPYIPNMKYYEYRERHALMKGSNEDGNSSSVQMWRPDKKTSEQIEEAKTDDGEKGYSSFSLSSDEFPSLTSMKRSTSSQVQKSRQQGANDQQPEDYPLALKNIKFGRIEISNAESGAKTAGLGCDQV